MANNRAGTGSRLTTVPIAPHILLFWIYNLIYYVPLLVIYIWGYSEGDAAKEIALDLHSLSAITILYLEGLIAFSLGSFLASTFQSRFLHAQRTWSSSSQPHFGTPETITVLLVAVMFLCAKAALVPLGVYSIYAYDTGEMTSGIWSFSMFCAECVLLLSILVLFSGTRHNKFIFLVLSLLNGINLLHGTRIIFIANVMVVVVYAYLRGSLTLRKMLILGPILFAAVLGMTYTVFLSRSNAFGNELSIARVLSPIVYESLFSQISLRNVVNTPDIMNSTGALPDFFVDVFSFITPRFLLPDKDSYLYLTRFTELSPLGAFNGYATGLIYFGVFWPIFYLVLGGLASWLYRKARTNAYWLIFYVYFAADALFRFMRDGYVIPIKIIANIIELIALLVIFNALFKGLLKAKVT
jgi:oligosaccharide repeat unit polymerase